MKIVDLDFVFISFDEPNADENYRHLLKIVPTAQRVHGVRGYDTAHKQAATIARTDNFIVVDGDCKIRSDFIEQELEFNDGINLNHNVISWPSYNPVNGLCYGNGGIKCWPKQLMLSQNTHENGSGVDFNYKQYLQMNKVGGDTIINGSPLQAWRGGFRDGIKLRLENGYFQYGGHPDKDNRQRLWNWQNIGSDCENGLYAMAGARHSVKLAETGWDITQINDLKLLNQMFHDTNVLDYLDYNFLSVRDSQHYKTKFVNPPRSSEEFLRDKEAPRYDIVYISYDEPYTDERYLKLKTRFPSIKRVHGVHGIHNAHYQAAKIVNTDYFWVVDADAEIVENFNFDFRAPIWDMNCVRVWRAINPVNGLEYGYGGVKLLPRKSVLTMDMTKPDMTTSISSDYRPVFVISNITNFDVDPFRAWRGAFRECVKLSSQIIDRQNSKETLNRLHIWCTVADNTNYKTEIIQGALAGKSYGENNKADISKLQLINDYEWLRKIYDEQFQ